VKSEKFCFFESNPLEKGFVDLDVLRLGGFGDENIGEDHRYSEEDDNDDQALSQPTLCFPHPGNALIFPFLGAHRSAIMMMVMRHTFIFF